MKLVPSSQIVSMLLTNWILSQNCGVSQALSIHSPKKPQRPSGLGGARKTTTSSRASCMQEASARSKFVEEAQTPPAWRACGVQYVKASDPSTTMHHTTATNDGNVDLLRSASSSWCTFWASDRNTQQKKRNALLQTDWGSRQDLKGNLQALC